MTKTQISAVAFSAIALMSGAQAQTAAPAKTPTQSFPVPNVNVGSNSYQIETGAGRTGGGNSFSHIQVVDCTSGLISTFVSGYNGIQTRSVAELAPKAQETIRANCNSNGLRAGF